jgi:hypothetical protein
MFVTLFFYKIQSISESASMNEVTTVFYMKINRRLAKSHNESSSTILYDEANNDPRETQLNWPTRKLFSLNFS